MVQPKRILIVDDEASNRELLEALLTGLGHEVDLAVDGAEALEKLDRTHDLVLLDVMMAGIDGFETARRIRSDSFAPDVPICMVTALSGREERLRAVDAGANDFISKPIDKTELQVRIASLLKIKQGQDIIRQYLGELETKNDQLEENYDRLRKLGEQKDEFIGIASHDLKNPLTCILGLTFLIDHKAPVGAAMTDETHGLVVKITRQCRVMQKIIENFLDFQALEDGQINLTQAMVNMNELVREVMERNAVYAQTKNMIMRLDIESETLMVSADKSRVHQILDNLIGNAIKFSALDQKVTVRTRRVKDGGVLVEVIDSGPGLKDEDMKKLFVKYARLSNAPTGDENSSGLGLAICKKLIEMQGGQAGARNNDEGGATFWFELPANGAAPSAPPVSETAA